MNFEKFVSCWWLVPMTFLVGAITLPAILWRRRSTYVVIILGIIAIALVAAWASTWKNVLETRAHVWHHFVNGDQEHWGPRLKFSKGECSLEWEWLYAYASPGRTLPIGYQFSFGGTFAPYNYPLRKGKLSPWGWHLLDSYVLQVARYAPPRGSIMDIWDFLVVTPIWLPLALCLLPVGIWIYKSRKGRAQGRNGTCPTCGYDLRASTEKCPECGTPIPHPKLSLENPQPMMTPP